MFPTKVSGVRFQWQPLAAETISLIGKETSAKRNLIGGFWGKVTKKNYLDVEDLEVYKRLCQLQVDVCDLTHGWPKEERYELGSQVRRSSDT